jgi:hypothetical protein
MSAVGLQPATRVAAFHSGGASVGITGSRHRLVRALLDDAGVRRVDAVPAGRTDLLLTLDRGPLTPALPMTLVTRGVHRCADGSVLLRNVGGSGFDQLWTFGADQLRVRSHWAPPPAVAAATLLRSRARALRAQVLLHHPVLWWGVMHGAAPLHVALLSAADIPLAVAGPGGVGKSTLVLHSIERGDEVWCDNLASCDGESAYAVAETLRAPVDAVTLVGGRRAAHDRREVPWPGLASQRVLPRAVVVARRGDDVTRVRRIAPEEAARQLVAGTHAAGELRRFWPLAAMLALAGERGPSSPPVAAVADELTRRLPCFEVQFGADRRTDLGVLLGDLLDGTRSDEARPEVHRE